MSGALAERWWRRLFWAGLRKSTQVGPDFLTFHARPKRAAEFRVQPDLAAESEQVAVVLQGPIATEDDFTLETLRIYRQHLPAANLVLSTWSDTPAAALEPLRSLGVDVVLCGKPAVAGLFNVNLQLTSAAQGVLRARDAGAQWILKSRTDQRLCAPNAVAFLKALALTFPCAPGSKQRHRVIGVGQGTLKYALYHLTDQTVFGHVDDMVRYWTPSPRFEAPPPHWPQGLQEILATVPMGELNRLASAESFFASRFLEGIGRPLSWTLEDSWSAFRDCFCVADFGATDFYWVKGQQYTWRELYVEYDELTNRRELGFSDWLLLYSGKLRPADAARHEDLVSSKVSWPRVDRAFR
jgi:hypothetical protein